MATDEELLRAWRLGDKDAGEELLGSHFESVYRFFRSKIGDDATDLVQSTFLACLESSGEMAEGAFRGYLFGIARRKLADHLRAKYNGGIPVDLDEVSVEDLRTTPSQALGRSEEQQLLERAMRHLPLDWQMVLELAYWEELTGKEIAAVFGIPENTVRSRLARAKERLRQQFEILVD